MNQQNEQTGLEQSTDVGTDVQNVESVQASRRKFLTKVGISTLPVVLSVQSGSAWGCIKLDCAPGAVNLSGTSSAVASARQNSQDSGGNYVLPLWPKREDIMRICAVDFDKYLINIKNPLTYKGKVVRGNRTVKQVFGMCGDLNPSHKIFGHTYSKNHPNYTNPTGVLTMTSLEGYFMAAFLGSLWERHSAYLHAFKPQPNSQYCYPEPDLLVQAYKNACTNGQKAEMLHIFQAYSRERQITGLS